MWNQADVCLVPNPNNDIGVASECEMVENHAYKTYLQLDIKFILIINFEVGSIFHLKFSRCHTFSATLNNLGFDYFNIWGVRAVRNHYQYSKLINVLN